MKQIKITNYSNYYEIECENEFSIKFTHCRVIGQGVFFYDHPYHYGGERDDGSEILDNLDTYLAFISSEMLSQYEIITDIDNYDIKKIVEKGAKVCKQ